MTQRYILICLDPDRDYPADAAALMEMLDDFHHADVTDIVTYQIRYPHPNEVQTMIKRLP